MPPSAPVDPMVIFFTSAVISAVIAGLVGLVVALLNTRAQNERDMHQRRREIETTPLLELRTELAMALELYQRTTDQLELKRRNEQEGVPLRHLEALDHAL